MKLRTSLARRAAAVGVGAALCLGAASADAAPCANLTNPIYGLGGSASKPFLAKVSKALANLPGPDTATIVFQAPGACLGIYAVVDQTLITGTASFWGADGVETTCELPVGGQ